MVTNAKVEIAVYENANADEAWGIVGGSLAWRTDGSVVRLECGGWDLVEEDIEIGIVGIGARPEIEARIARAIESNRAAEADRVASEARRREENRVLGAIIREELAALREALVESDRRAARRRGGHFGSGGADAIVRDVTDHYGTKRGSFVVGGRR